MSDLTTTGAFAIPRPDDDPDRESRHQVLATLLGAYADGEVPSETASQIDAHLLGCSRCRSELEVHRAIRARLEREPIPAASPAMRERVLSGILAAPATQAVAQTQLPAAVQPPRRWTFWMMAAVLVVAAIAGAMTVRSGTQAPQASYTVVTSPSLPLFDVVLADYRRVIATDLPGRSRDLATVREALPFPVNALVSPKLRLLAAWTTDLGGEPAAVLAYRWNDQLVLQYVVSEQLLFRPPELRRAFAGGRQLASQVGDQSVIAWPSAAGGELLVADMAVNEIAALRATVIGR